MDRTCICVQYCINTVLIPDSLSIYGKISGALLFITISY